MYCIFLCNIIILLFSLLFCIGGNPFKGIDNDIALKAETKHKLLRVKCRLERMSYVGVDLEAFWWVEIISSKITQLILFQLLPSVPFMQMFWKEYILSFSWYCL